MDPNRLTEKAQDAIRQAQSLAQRQGQPQIDAEHLAVALLGQDGGVAARVVEKAGAQPGDARAAAAAGARPPATGLRARRAQAGQVYVAPRVNEVLNAAEAEAQRMKDEYVSVEHLLLALADLKDGARGRGLPGRRPHPREAARGAGGRPGRPARDEPDAGGDLRGAREVRARPHRARPAGQARPGHRPRRGDPPRHPDPLAPDQEQPRADRRAGRGQDGDRGGPGPAHRARRRARGAQGQAHRDARHGRAGRRREVPRRVRGAAQGRAQGRAGRRRARSSSSSTSCTRWWARGRPRAPWTRATCSSPPLARGELHCIGATTLDEYQKHIEKDAALERRFQPVMVDQPTVEDTISILRGLRERYEVHHGVRIKDAALVAAAVLSDRYIADRFLPDKAIDLVDEAAARLRTEIDSMPAELDEITRRILQLEIEREALKKETDAAVAGPPGEARGGAGRPAGRRPRRSASSGSARRRRSSDRASSASASRRSSSRSTRRCAPTT